MVKIDKFKKILKEPAFWIGVTALVIICFVAFPGQGTKGKYDYTKALRGNLIQEVSVTGNIRPIEGVDLAFEKSGRVEKVAVEVHDKVYRGEPLVFLEADSLYAELNEAVADLEYEKTKLLQIKRGPTDYEVKVKKAEVEEAEQDLENDYNDVVVTVENAYSQADDAVRAKTAELFKKVGDSYALNYNACNSSAENRANFSRLVMELMLDEWRQELDSLGENPSRGNLDEAITTAQENLLEVNQFLNYVNGTLETGCELSDSDIATYRGKIGTARDNISSALSSVNALEQSIASNQSALNRVERELEKLLAGASEEEIKMQEAAVKKASAKVNNIKAQIEEMILRAPFSGKVTKVNAKVGEIVDAYDTVVSVISGSDFKIEVNIPEVDVPKVKVGDKARVTLDAYGEKDIFEAKVVTIDSAETVVEGVSTYKATLEFEKPDERIKSGMTANVDIITGERGNVVYIPQRAVIEEDGKSFVRVLGNKEVEKREVVTGMEDSMGNIEIVKGLKEGEKVVVFVNG